jgi:hypothetical protein
MVQLENGWVHKEIPELSSDTKDTKPGATLPDQLGGKSRSTFRDAGYRRWSEKLRCVASSGE